MAIPLNLRFRRLFVGWSFWGSPATGVLSAHLQFLGPGNGAPAEYLFEWAFPSTSLMGNPILKDPASGALAVPPFSVESIPDGSAAPFPTPTPAQRDELAVATLAGLGSAETHLIRMMPIPLLASADRVQVRVRSAFTADGSTDPTYGMQFVVAVRSSLSFPG